MKFWKSGILVNYLVLFICVSVIYPIQASAALIDFDSLSEKDIVTDQYASLGVLISSSYGDVTINTNSTFADTGANSLNGGDFREVIVTFVNPLDTSQAATTDFFQMTLGDIDIQGNGMTAFDVSGNQIGQIVYDCASCPRSVFDFPLFETLSLSVTGIHTVVISAGGQIFGDIAQAEATVDTFIFNDVSAVPVPAAVWLFGSGLIGLAGFTRRKKA